MANSGASDYLAIKLLDHSLGTTAYTMPENVYLAAYYGDPYDSGSEMSGGAYARQAVTFSAAATTASGAIASNAAQVLFPVATDNWSTVDNLAAYDAETEGHLIWGGPMTEAKVIGTGDQLKVVTGAFGVQQNRTSS